MSFWIYGCWTRNSWRDANLETLRDNNPTDLSHVKTHWRLISRLQLTDHTKLFVSDKFPPEICDTDIYTNEIRDCIFFSTLRFYLEISARYISLSTPAQQRWDIKNNTFSPAVFVARRAVPVTRDKLQIALWTLCTGIMFCWRNGLWEQVACAVD